ncbi:MAG: ABC transporter ATP-binding protein [Chloroflexi bacterium]|nr:ABC transporter ATP-binding protein [Chloroflexota bacterium]MDA8187965.1 ABC transporter ATP-binding protein [Dehalococcoidales bacterium]
MTSRAGIDSSTTDKAGSQDSQNVLVEMRGITKRFPGVVANDGITLTIRRGEIHAVLGENGAGKTTLMNILSGMVCPDEGTIVIRGQEANIESPQDALRHRIGTVYQHFTLVPNLSIIENVVLGTPSRFVLALNQAEQRLREMLGGFELTVPLQTQVRHLSIGQQQRVEILKVVFRGSEVLLLDEPTSVLTPVEVKELFGILLGLKAQGVSLVLITHKLEEALEVSDRITILRQGKNVGELGPAALAGKDDVELKQRIVDLMFGGLPPQENGGRAKIAAAPAVLSLRDITALGDRGTLAVQEMSLELRASEIFGIAGVDGNGQKELAEVIAGQRLAVKGRVTLDGVEITNCGTSAAVKAGIVYVSDDRLGEASVPAGSVADNLVLKAIDRAPFSKRAMLNWSAIQANALRLIHEFEVKAPGPWTRLSTLSGGNIQKLLLARELALQPKVLVCNKPTHGLDLKTVRFVLQTLRAQADKGTVIVLISSELDEILALSDRIGVMYNGRLLATFERDEADLETIGHLMLGVRI